MWEKELEIIDSLGKLYPKFVGIEYNHYRENDYYKARWVSYLCASQLKRRIPRLEEFIKENNKSAWIDHRWYFNITEE